MLYMLALVARLGQVLLVGPFSERIILFTLLAVLWPGPIAPFDLCLVPIGVHKSTAIAEASEKLYQTLRDADIDVLFDDRNERPGVMFADMDLVGIPHRLVIGERD